MRNALILFGTLADPDIDWMAGAGRRVRLAPGERLIAEGETIDAVYIVLEGRLGVSAGGVAVGSLAPGEVVGETSFLDGAPPTATVTASEPSAVLALDRARLESRLARDDGFAARMYRSLAVTVAARLRSVLHSSASRAAAPRSARDGAEEIPTRVLDRSAIAARNFSEFVRRVGGGT